MQAPGQEGSLQRARMAGREAAPGEADPFERSDVLCLPARMAPQNARHRDAPTWRG